MKCALETALLLLVEWMSRVEPCLKNPEKQNVSFHQTGVLVQSRYYLQCATKLEATKTNPEDLKENKWLDLKQAC